jgi:hypothetical protein
MPRSWAPEPPKTPTFDYRTIKDRFWMQQDGLERSRSGSDEISEESFRHNAKDGNLRFADPGKGTLISSLIGPDQHLPILDLDLPHKYVPSRSSGHGHLYLNHKPLTDAEYFTFMVMLEKYGVVSRGSLEQLKAVNASTVRPPPGEYRHVDPADRWRNDPL